MKRILLLPTVFIMMLGTNLSFAQVDADNFYKSDLVNCLLYTSPSPRDA